MNTLIQFIRKSAYGVTRIYPEPSDLVACTLVSLTGKQTVTEFELKQFEAIGFTVLVF